MATANVEYPQPLAHRGNPIIYRRLYESPVPATAVPEREGQHCATPQGDRYTGVRDLFSLEERLPGETCEHRVGPKGGGVSFQPGMPAGCSLTFTRRNRPGEGYASVRL